MWRRSTKPPPSRLGTNRDCGELTIAHDFHVEFPPDFRALFFLARYLIDPNMTDGGASAVLLRTA